MIPNLNKVKLPFLEREKCAIPEIEFRYVFVLIHRPGAWTLDRSRLPLTPNPFYLKNGILVDGFEQWKINCFFRKFRLGKQDFFSFTKRE